MSKNRGKNTQL